MVPHTREILASLLILMAAAPGCRKHAGRPASGRSGATGKDKSRFTSSVGPLKSPLDAKDTAGAKQRFVELLRRELNRKITDPARQGRWDFWSEGSSRYTLPDGTRAWLMSFRRTSPTSQEGFLVIGTISGQNTVVYGYWKVNAGIDDIHVMDMGKAGKFIYTVSFDTTGVKRVIYHHLLRFDGRALKAVWSYRLGYELLQPRTYKPVSVTFRDEDKDGTREVRIRIPGKDTPRLWKRRWAMFKWNAPQSEFLPLRGLAFTPVSGQKPLWAAFGFLEAVRLGTRNQMRRFGTDRRHCRSVEELWDTFVRRKYKPVGAPRRKRAVAPHKDRKASVLVDLERPGDSHRYLAELELVRERKDLSPWTLCRIRFFRL